MNYTFTPLTDEQIEDKINLIELNRLMPKGIYKFEIAKSTRKISQAGNTMSALQHTFWDETGKTYTIFGNLIFSDIPFNIRTVKNFCETTGMQERYKLGQIPERLERLCGMAEVGIEEKKPDGKGGFYAAKNIVIDYVSSDKKVTLKQEKQSDSKDFIDDDVLF